MITPDDVRVELGKESLTPAETARIQQWIVDAYDIIRDRYPGGVKEAKAGRAVRTTVARYALMPKAGETAHEVGVDDARTVRRYSATSSGVTLEDLLAAWWPTLDAEPSGASFTIVPGVR